MRITNFSRVLARSPTRRVNPALIVLFDISPWFKLMISHPFSYNLSYNHGTNCHETFAHIRPYAVSISTRFNSETLNVRKRQISWWARNSQCCWSAQEIRVCNSWGHTSKAFQMFVSGTESSVRRDLSPTRSQRFKWFYLERRKTPHRRSQTWLSWKVCYHLPSYSRSSITTVWTG